MTAAVWRSALVAAVFAVHPLHVESVVWITERKDVLSALLGFLAIGAYARYARNPGAFRYLTVAAALALGLMAKPILATWPLVFLVLDYWPLGRWKLEEGVKGRREEGEIREVPVARLVLEKVPLFLLAAAATAATLAGHSSRGAVASLEAAPISGRVACAVMEYVGYLGKTFWPVGLAPMYHAGPIVSHWPALAAGTLLALITAAAIWAAKRGQPWLAAGWLFYVVTLVPMVGLVQAGVQIMPDRSLYLPQIGLTMALAWGIAGIVPARAAFGHWPGARGVLAGAAALVLALLAARSWQQTSYWRDSESLWRYTLQCTPDSALAHNHLGLALVASGRVDEAIEHYERAVQIEPGYSVARFNLGLALDGRGRFAAAIEQYGKEIELAPRDAEAHYRLSMHLAAPRGSTGSHRTFPQGAGNRAGQRGGAPGTCVDSRDNWRPRRSNSPLSDRIDAHPGQRGGELQFRHRAGTPRKTARGPGALSYGAAHGIRCKPGESGHRHPRTHGPLGGGPASRTSSVTCGICVMRKSRACLS